MHRFAKIFFLIAASVLTVAVTLLLIYKFLPVLIYPNNDPSLLTKAAYDFGVPKNLHKFTPACPATTGSSCGNDKNSLDTAYEPKKSNDELFASGWKLTAGSLVEGDVNQEKFGESYVFVKKFHNSLVCISYYKTTLGSEKAFNESVIYFCRPPDY